jgi:sigma-B regulation protein RsbU (phosphoserine phosphatase)
MNSILTPIFEGGWRQRLEIIVDMMRDMSRQTDPEDMVRSYGSRIRHAMPNDRGMSLSRRDLKKPQYRITRSSLWKERINPWTEKERLPLLEGGLLAELIYGDEPRIIDELELAPDDPAAEYFVGQRSLMAVPMYDQGVSLNMIIRTREQPGAFPRENLPEMLLMSNLFGRATRNLVMSQELDRAYQALDQELAVVGRLQRSLLPAELPKIPTLDLAAFYQPSQRAGGDYYDFFPLPDGRWGIFIADVSGHGPPAAVLMAVTHCIAHTYPGPPIPPAGVLNYLNHQLATLYTQQNENFVTAFYGIYNPADRTLTYSRAGHNPPRLKRCSDGSLMALDGTNGFPLGIETDGVYSECMQQFLPGDQIIFYTDGVTEAHNARGEMFGTERLDEVLENCSLQATALLDSVLQSVESFAAGHAADDDRTLIVTRVV